MSITIRPARERGHADHGWLDTWHTFSFADYYDHRHMGFRSLRVINDDRVTPGEGFGTHPHQNMEIFTYVVEGALAHKDSMGHASTIKAGEVQKITAGRGITHSEFNASDKQPVHLYQIWIQPDKNGLVPSYKEVALPEPDPEVPLFLIGAPPGKGGLVDFHQDVLIFRGVLTKGQKVPYAIKPGRGLWVQIVKGCVRIGEHSLRAGDGASLEAAAEIMVMAAEPAEFLLFDLA
ncbi:MAG: pirin family protein [Candidatus Omnitrophota bacterium]